MATKATKPARKPTNLSLDSELVSEARALKVNLSQSAEQGVRAAVAAAKTERWKRENAEAIRSANEYVEKHGLPLEKYRMF